jgi:hypothetical protein
MASAAIGFVRKRWRYMTERNVAHDVIAIKGLRISFKIAEKGSDKVLWNQSLYKKKRNEKNHENKNATTRDYI